MAHASRMSCKILRDLGSSRNGSGDGGESGDGSLVVTKVSSRILGAVVSFSARV
jgi:hypothetical protein